jgi:hypothetical protein
LLIGVLKLALSHGLYGIGLSRVGAYSQEIGFKSKGVIRHHCSD